MNGDDGVPIEQFIQALTSQLDRVQTTMALKARAGMPLTFAVKDLTLDLRAHVHMVGSVILVRPAAPNEREASTIHLNVTTITRPMIEENTIQMEADEPSLKEVLGEDLNEDEQRRLEWAGIHHVSQLRDLGRYSSADELQKFTQLPVDRLRKALDHASRPRVTRVVPIRPAVSKPRTPVRRAASGDVKRVAVKPTPDRAPLLRIRGDNLVRNRLPKVRIGDQQAPVLRATERELLIQPTKPQRSGLLTVEVAPGQMVEHAFELSEADWEEGEPMESADGEIEVQA